MFVVKISLETLGLVVARSYFLFKLICSVFADLCSFTGLLVDLEACFVSYFAFRSFENKKTSS